MNYLAECLHVHDSKESFKRDISQQQQQDVKDNEIDPRHSLTCSLQFWYKLTIQSAERQKKKSQDGNTQNIHIKLYLKSARWNVYKMDAEREVMKKLSFENIT